MQYCSLQHWTLLLLSVTSTTGCCFLLWLRLFILSGVVSAVISTGILGTYQPGEFIFQCPIFLLFHTVHGVLKARILKWFTIPFSNGPRFVRTLHYDPSILGGPARMAHSLTELCKTLYRDKAVIHEGVRLKQKQCSPVVVSGGECKVRYCKEQYCIGTWNVRPMNQGKLDVVKEANSGRQWRTEEPDML